MQIFLALFFLIADSLATMDSSVSIQVQSEKKDTLNLASAIVNDSLSIAQDALKLKLSADADTLSMPQDSLRTPKSLDKADSLANASIELSDEAFQKINYESAAAILEKLYLKDSSEAELLWRMARLNICIGDAIACEKRETRAVYYDKAVKYGRKAVAADKKNAQAHAWLAAAYGVKAENSDTKERIKLANQIKQEIDLSLELDSTNGIAYSILGSYHRIIADIGWFERMIANTFLGSVPDGQYEEAEVAFKKAIKLQPNVLRHYHEFALLYLDMGKDEEAIKLLKAALKKPILMKNDKKRKLEIKALLKEYGAE